MSGTNNLAKTLWRRGAGGWTQLHVVLAEKALGKPLPYGAQVHHVDGNPTNNSPDNLVICPSQDYHMLLHRRQRALDACGHADWLKCCRCKRYDAPENLSIKKYKKWMIYHLSCARAYHRKLKGE